MKNAIIACFLILIVCSCKDKEQSYLIDPDYSKSEIGLRTFKEAYNGKQSLMLCESNPYAFGDKKIPMRADEYVRATCFAKGDCSTYNLFAASSWGKYYNGNYIKNCNDNDWNKIELLIEAPDTIENGYVQFYAFQFGRDTILVDNLNIKTSKEYYYKDSLPNHLAIQLTYQLINELNIHGVFPNRNDFTDEIHHTFLEKLFGQYHISQKAYKTFLSKHPNHFDEVIDFFDSNKMRTYQNEVKEEHHTLAAYSNKIVYSNQELITITTKNTDESYIVKLFSLEPEYKTKLAQNVGQFNSKKFSFKTDNLATGVYQLQLNNQRDSFNLPIIINEQPNTTEGIAILTPITTWHAYNDYDGKSFYRNRIDDQPVYTVSTERPLLSAHFDSVFLGHDLFILDNVIDYYKSKGEVVVYPDYYLDSHPKDVLQQQTMVLAQHCEYFSPKMFNTLRTISKTKNLIDLGGNQCFYKISFADNYSTIECHKDGSFHYNSFLPGGTWKTDFSSEASLIGNTYTDAGYATYHPYQVTNPNHWIYENTNAKSNSIFGEHGIDHRGISGDEMNKIDESTPQNAVLLAKGMNPNNGGGEIVLIEKDSVATYSTGSIASGAGLNIDATFTKMMDNFLDQYHK